MQHKLTKYRSAVTNYFYENKVSPYIGTNFNDFFDLLLYKNKRFHLYQFLILTQSWSNICSYCSFLNHVFLSSNLQCKSTCMGRMSCGSFFMWKFEVCGRPCNPSYWEDGVWEWLESGKPLGGPSWLTQRPH